MSDGAFPLDTIQVASPCGASWDAMPGSGRVRHCQQCGQRVYNVAALSRREAEDLLRQAEGRLCVRLYRRTDGTVLTADCPAGLRRLRRTGALVAGAFAALVLAAVGWASSPGPPTGGVLARLGRGRLPAPVQAFLDWIDPPPMMGAICPPSRLRAGRGNPTGLDPEDAQRPAEAREAGPDE